MENKWYYRSHEGGLERKLAQGITTRVFFSKSIMLSVADIAPHTEPSIHSHPEEQWGYLLEGECVRIQDGEEVAMKKGDFWRTPANTPHGVRTGASGAKILDVFNPPRNAYTKLGEGLAATQHPRIAAEH
jgi:unsaturated pyranuronate lyase